MKYDNNSIKAVIKEINKSYFLPDMQRPFVWLKKPDEHKIEDLFDSLMKDYPIGIFLIWKVKKENTNNFKISKFIKNGYANEENESERISVSEIDDKEYKIVLDGQQRLTALYIGFQGKCIELGRNGKEIEKELYVNLRHKRTQENLDEQKYQFKFLTEEAAKEENKDVKWYKVKDLFDIKSLGIFYGKLSQEEYEIISMLYSRLTDINTIYYCESDDIDMENALEIFVRVNSGGVVLSRADLLLSIMICNFNDDIKQSIQYNVKKWAEIGFPQVNKDILLKTCLLLLGRDFRLKVTNFNESNLKDIQDNWDKIISSINRSIQLVIDFGYQGKSLSANIIPAIALYDYLKRIKVTDNSYILKFIQRASITGFLSSKSTNSDLKNFRDIVNESYDFKTVFEKLKDELEIDENKIKKIVLNTEKDSFAAFPILQLLSYQNNSGNHIDHIYPYTPFNRIVKKLNTEYWKKDKSKRDKLFNLQLLTGQENTNKSDTEPQEWIDKTFPSDEARQKYRKEHLIPDMQLTWKNIEKFEEKRKEMLVERLKEIFNIK